MRDIRLPQSNGATRRLMPFAAAWGSRSREHANDSPDSQPDLVRSNVAEQRWDACLLCAARDLGDARRWCRPGGSRYCNSTARVAQRAQAAGVRDGLCVAHSEWGGNLVFAV